MKRLVTFFSFYAALMPSIVCCTFHVDDYLVRADDLIMSNPDSALIVLTNIDTTRLRSPEQRARYSLLHTMAIDRAGKDTTDYGLIRYASEYYSNHGSSIEKTRTLFYEGRLHFNNQDYTSAQMLFLRALKESENTADEWLKGMINYFLADTYTKNHLNAEALEYSLSSYNHFMLYGDSKYVDNALYLLGVANHNVRHYEAADSLYAIVGLESDSYKYALLARAENELMRAAPNIPSALSYFDEAYNEGAPFELYNLYEYAYALLLDRQTSRAERLLEQLDIESPDIKSLWWKYAIAKKKDILGQALTLHEEYTRNIDNYLTTTLAQSLYKAESAYLSSMQEQMEKQATTQKLLFAFSLVLFLLIVFVFLYINQKRLRNSEKERSLLILKISQMQDILDEKKHEAIFAEIQSSYIALIREQYSEIGKLLGVNLNVSTSFESLQSMHIEYINNIIDEITSKEENDTRLEDRINRTMDNIIVKLRNDFPRFGNETIRFLSLVIIGLKDQAIAFALNKSKSAVSTRKSRLKQQILTSGSQYVGLYELFLK